MNHNTKIQVVIATYNRSKLLSETLSSLARTISNRSDTDIVVVDNLSNDDTSSVARSFIPTMPRLSIVHESSQGLSFARNRGIISGDGDIIVFLDDDVEVAPNWLPELLRPFDDPNVAVSGGKVLPFGMQKFPEWLPREYGFLASVFDPSDSICEVDKVMGANFAVRRATFDAVGLFDINLGRKGSKLLGGEEVELFHRIRKRGNTIAYTPHSIVWHKISEKLKLTYIEDYAYWLGVSEAIIDKKIAHPLKYPVKAMRSILFPSTLYALQQVLTRYDNSAATRYTIKRNYARGYLAKT